MLYTVAVGMHLLQHKVFLLKLIYLKLSVGLLKNFLTETKLNAVEKILQIEQVAEKIEN